MQQEFTPGNSKRIKIMAEGESEGLKQSRERVVDKKDLSVLEGQHRGNSYPFKFWTKIVNFIHPSSLPKWKKSEVEKIVEDLNEKICADGLEDKNYFLSGFEGTSSVLVPNEEKVNVYLIDGEEKEVVRGSSNVIFEGVRTEKKRNRFVLVNGANQKLSFEFQSNEERDEFAESLREELNSVGIYQYRKVWNREEKIKEIKRAEIGLNNNFQNLSPYQFEEFIEDLFEQLGYDARKTPNSGDFGIDVIANSRDQKIAVQAKRHKSSNKVGSPTVRDTLGSIHRVDADKAIVITTSTFTRPAFQQARNSPIELWDRKKLRQVVEDKFINLD